MASKKLQNILKEKIYKTTFFEEEYEVRFTSRSQ
jgi:hypothetical protein